MHALVIVEGQVVAEPQMGLPWTAVVVERHLLIVSGKLYVFQKRSFVRLNSPLPNQPRKSIAGACVARKPV